MVLYNRAISLFRDRPKLMAIASLWAMLWLSINGESAIQKEGFFSPLHMGRLLFPYVAASIALLWLSYLRVKPKIELWQIAFIGYAGFVLGRGLFLDTPLIALHFHAAILCTMCLLVLCTTLIATDNTLSSREIIFSILLINFAFICVLLLVFFPRDAIQSILMNSISGYFSQSEANTVVGMESPRPTGISRLASVVTLFALAAFVSGVWRTRLTRVLIYFGTAIVIYYQARGPAVALTAVGVFFLMLVPRQNWPSLADAVRFFVGTALALAAITAIILFGIFLLSVEEKLGTSSFGFSVFSETMGEISGELRYSRDFFPAEAGSGRLRHWGNGWNVFLTEPIFGLGGQADRFHIGQNVSNMFVYILLCGGLVGGGFSILAVAKALQTVWISINTKQEGQEKTEKFLSLSSLTVFAFLSARGLVENSYALFNIDFLLVIPTIWFLSLKSHERVTLRKNK
jgi:hypothetical protein